MGRTDGYCIDKEYARHRSPCYEPYSLFGRS